MSKKDLLATESYKGVRDFFPEDQSFFNYLTKTMREVAERFGYVEYHASVLEPSELYRSKGSQNAEMVNDQTYTFVDRGGREVTLRPEMTPTVARMVAARRRDFGYPLRLYSIPNVFRYERPQRGRLREHWQFNVDIFGSHALEADAEIVSVAHALLLALGATENDFVIKLGSRNFLNAIKEQLNLSDDAGRKLALLLDRRAKLAPGEFERDLADIGVAIELLSPDRVPDDVKEVLHILQGLGITNAVFDPSIIRGFDYYSGVVYEVFDTHPDNNRSVFGGGRYDNLLALFDEEVVPGVGIAAGDAPLREFLEVRGLIPTYVPPTKVYVAVSDRKFAEVAMQLAAQLRLENVSVATDFGEKKLGDQIKTATKHKIPYLIVVGEDEVASGTYTVKNLETGATQSHPKSDLASFFLTLN